MSDLALVLNQMKWLRLLAVADKSIVSVEDSAASDCFAYVRPVC